VVYAALHAGSYRLAAMGTRALLDMLFNDSVGDIGGFDERMKAMRTKGDISARQEEFLRPAVDFGSAATHRGHVPSGKDLNTAIDIVENLLQAHFVLNEAGSELKAHAPARTKAKKK
jgi:hypothetical protein